ncbi:MAG TPA: hypothetical protein VM425_11575 [Myxococcota bacterium]|nr:hypothetical protein [Myxococcota bacterium]
MTSSQRARSVFLKGKMEFEKGNVLGAYRTLAGPRPDRVALGLGYTKLLRKVTRAAEYLIEHWLQKGDFWAKQGNLPKAYKYYSDIAGNLPDRDPLRRKLLGKARLLGERLSYLKKSISDLVEQGRDDFRRGRIKEARAKLLEARWMALENNLSFDIATERLIEECNRRAPSEFDLVLNDEPEGGPVSPLQSVLKIPLAPKKNRKTPSRTKRPTIRPSSPPADILARSVQVTEMLQQVRDHMRTRKFAKAITLLNKVLAIDPESQEAKALFARLAPIHKQLVSDLMKKANDYFAREELGKARPFYLRVLQIDPNNIRAKEGLQMYHRLKELKEREK